MKKQITIALALLVGSFSFAQKNELKAAEKAIKSNNYAEAKSAINSAESLIASADDKTKAQFYFLKGQALYANGAGSNKDMDSAIESFNKVWQIEAGKGKYSGKVEELKSEMLNNFLTKAYAALESKNYAVSSNGFEKAYRMSPKDTTFLYYAAATAISSEDYDSALKYYIELKELGFNGKDTQYLAVNKENGEVESFNSKSLRDISVIGGTHISPSEKVSESKKAEIIKNIALIYISKGENQLAINAIKDARKVSPDDLSLLMSEANVQLKLGNKQEFKKLIEEATSKDPNNAELQYNLGVIAAEAGDQETAKKYYNKAIALDQNYTDAQNNMAVLILQGEKDIIDQMNNLGSSAADNNRYDELRDERIALYKEAIPYLESTLRISPSNLQAAKTLMNIYSAIDETTKFKEMKAKVEALEAGTGN